jgi:hypothetical protein
LKKLKKFIFLLVIFWKKQEKTSIFPYFFGKNRKKQEKTSIFPYFFGKNRKKQEKTSIFPYLK